MSAAKYVGPPVGPDDHPVLVVAEGRGPEPQRPVELVDVAARPQALDGPLHPALRVQRALGLPEVEPDPEACERGLDAGPDALGRPAPDLLGRVRRRFRRGEHVRRDLVRQVADVVAVVAVLRDRIARADREDRGAQVVHLRPEVVEVVLAARPRWPAASRTRQRRSPTNAPRALPTVSGPVGLADTNSTLTRRGVGAATRPQLVGEARIAPTVRSRARSARRRFTKPGGTA